MATPRRLSQLNRALSTPPTTPDSIMVSDSKAPQTPQQQRLGPSVLTPPTSPHLSRWPHGTETQTPSSNPNHSSPTSHPRPRGNHLEPLQTNALPNQTEVECSTAPQCPFDIEILKDSRGRDAYFGTGAWSIVYKATVRKGSFTSSCTQTGPERLTPPSSPVSSLPLLVAVKTPVRRDSDEILRNEAKTLNYLQNLPHGPEFIVPFYGVVEQSTIVLAAIPHTLEHYIRKSAEVASNSTSMMATSPIIGTMPTWLVLAHKLITALAWLHDQAGVIHGDLKPGNILLSPLPSTGLDTSTDSSFFNYTPLLADFSSSQLRSTTTPTPNTLSAVTREYTAPELLSSAVLRNPESTATTDSDVFSLAVTLLVAVTGQMLVYPGSVFQRQAMATQGWLVLSHVRNGVGGERVARGGLVEKILEPAVRKIGTGRINAMEWLRMTEELAKTSIGAS
ncbi:hypothetical protein B0A52_01227 [Exophiala mesophila]|uniref:Protein kinase domain-containing protein n=1 Tax=Exophiala mesophila TaxID=212818 RepID=A0A438NGU4_EXOME|nr:hypothetical protein B0A52_01227 [Exophiala mesophila]